MLKSHPHLLSTRQPQIVPNLHKYCAAAWVIDSLRIYLLKTWPICTFWTNNVIYTFGNQVKYKMLYAKALSKLRIAPLPTIISILTTLRNSIIKFPNKFCSQPSIDTRYLNKILEPKLSMFSTARPCCLKVNSRTSMMNNWNKKTNRIENKWMKEIDPKMWS